MLKKLFLLFVFLVLLPVTASADVSLSAFPDPELRSILSKYDTGWSVQDSDGVWHTIGYNDGVLSEQELSGITGLSLGSNVKSIQGTDSLTYLESLSWTFENLGSAMLNVKSNKLTSLYCRNVKLTSLNLSGCTALKYLHCEKNQLTELNVNGCTALNELLYYNSTLGSLNASDCTALSGLYCNSSKLESLDVSGCTALEHLNCDNIELKSLNVSGCTALTTLSCFNNNLNELDVRDCTALEHLQCAANQLTELDLSQNPAIFTNVSETNSFLWQKPRGLKLKKTSQDYEVNMSDYVSHLENITYIVNEQLRSYNEGTGIAVFGGSIESLNYGYNTHAVMSGQNVIMPVRITNALSVVALERGDFSTYTHYLIGDITDDSYLDILGEPLTETRIASFSYSDYGKLGFTADGNSRLIIRVQTDKPGTVSFSFPQDIGAKLESLSREELSSSTQLSTTQFSDWLDETHNVSAVLVAPEMFPEGKNFPSDKFKIHVKFTDEDGETTEEDVELTIAAPPVLLIPGMFDNADETFGISRKTGVWYCLMSDGFDETHVEIWDYDGSKGPNELLANDYNDLFNKLNGMFGQYASDGIVCTKADIVAHGMGGLMARKFLTSERKDSDDGNNWTVRSYKQGMVHKLITIATPHRGTPWADTPDRSGLITTMYNAVLSSPFYGNHPGWEYLLKPFTFMIHTMFPSPQIFQDAYLAKGSAWSELKTTEPRSYGFPAKVPMFAITGDSAADSLVNDVWTLTTTLVDQTLNVNINIYDMPSFLVSNAGHILEALGRIGVFAEKAVLQGKIASVAKGIGIMGFIFDMPSYAKVFTDAFALSLFGNSGHDVMVSTKSATQRISNEIFTNTGKEALSKEKNGRYSHWSICQQVDVGVTVVSLLKDKHPSLYKFTVFDTETPEATGASMLAANYRTSENGSDDFDFTETLKLDVTPSDILTSTSSQTLKFTVVAPKTLAGNVYCTIGSDETCRFFKLIDTDGTGWKFQAELNAKNLLVNVDAGVLDVQCFSLIPDNSGMYTSNTVHVGWLTNTVSEDKDIEKTSAFEVSEGTLPDSNFRNYVSQTCDSNGDGILSVEEISSVKVISINNGDIASFKGIEHFTYLRELYCSDNNLTELDLSNNSLLEVLICNDNQLMSIDVSNCPNLRILECARNNLTELDVSNCTLLQKLAFRNNHIVEIDLSPNASLVELNCPYNDIKELDLINNLKLEILDCGSNDLEVLDVKANLSLRELWCFSNKLSALDVGQNTELTYLDCGGNVLTAIDVSSNLKLTTLECYRNQITELNVSSNSALEYLDCGPNLLTQLDVTNNKALKYLDCYNNQLATLNLVNNPALTYLDCASNKITGLNLDVCTNLQKLYCDSNELHELGLSRCLNLELIDCRNNKITTLDVSACKALKTFYCKTNRINVLDLVANTELVSVDCSANNLVWLNIDNCGKLKWLYCNENTITKLNIGGCPEFVEFLHDASTAIVYEHVPNPLLEPTPVPEPIPSPTPDSTPTPDPDPTSGIIEPYTPAVDFEKPTVKENIMNSLKARNPGMGNDVEISALPENSHGSARTIYDVSNDDLASIPISEDIAAVLPIITVEKDGVYVWGVQLDNLEAGAPITLYLFGEDGTSSAFRSSATTDGAYVFLDDDGNEVTTVPANKHINIAAFMEAGKTYAPIITTNTSGNSTSDPIPTPEVDNSSGGCSAFSVFTAVVLLLFFKKKNLSPQFLAEGFSSSLMQFQMC